MRVGVTGASGLIGSALVEALRERGDEVVVFVRNGAPRPGAVRWSPEGGEINADDLAAVGPLDAVVHLAGAGIADRRWTTAHRAAILTSREAGTSLLAKTLASVPTPPKVFVSGSAIGFYGSRGDEILTETSSTGDDYLAEVCQRWEAAAAPLVAAGVTVSYARTGIVMSRRGGALKKQLPLFRLGLGGRLGNGRQWLSPISLRDEVSALLFLIDHPLAGPVNLTAPAPLTNADFTRVLGRVLRRPALFAVPRVALRLVLGRELADTAIMASQRVEPRALLAAGFTFADPDAEAVIRSALA